MRGELRLLLVFCMDLYVFRYQDGRKTWTNIIVASKNMAQMVGCCLNGHLEFALMFADLGTCTS
jgi:predicted membrane chloride channel (bestrophin family)